MCIQWPFPVRMSLCLVAIIIQPQNYDRIEFFLSKRAQFLGFHCNKIVLNLSVLFVVSKYLTSFLCLYNNYHNKRISFVDGERNKGVKVSTSARKKGIQGNEGTLIIEVYNCHFYY